MKRKILIVNDWGGYSAPFVGIGEIVNNVNEFYKNPEDFELVVFTGGEDVNPSLYGETSPKRLCGFNRERDSAEVPIFELALKYKIPMTGICRGSQLLNVLCGGKLVHHLNGHGMSHQAKAAVGSFMVTSTHHQMCILASDAVLTMMSGTKRSPRYIGDKDEEFPYYGPEVEGFYYPTKNVFAVQYHPEYMPKESAGFMWYKQGIIDLLTITPEKLKEKYALVFSGYQESVKNVAM